MALVCPPLNFSFKCSSCFSALSGLSGGCFNFGGCFKSSDVKNLKEVESESSSNSSRGDGNSTASLTPTLPATGIFVMPIQDPENKNPEPIWINSVSVDLSHVDLSHNELENISQNPTTYNAPVRINGESNGQCIEIQSIFNNSVQNDSDMSELAESHMNEFSKLMLGEANASYEPKLQIPKRQVDELASNNDSKNEAMDPIFTKIDGGVVINMSNPIEEEVVLVRDLESFEYKPVPKVLRVRIVSQKRKNLGIILTEDGLNSSIEEPDLSPLFLSEEGLDSGAEVSVPTTPKPLLSESSSLGPIQPVLDTLTSQQDRLLSFSDKLSDDEDSDVKVSSDEYLNANARLDTKPVNARIRRRLVIFPEDNECFKAKSLEIPGEVNREVNREENREENREVNREVNYERTMTDVEYKNWENMEKKMNEESVPGVFEQFFENIVTQTNPSAFFTKLNEYVSSFENDIIRIFPSPAPASPRVDPDNQNGNVKE